NPQMVDVWERLATVLQRANRGDEAILVMRRIISLAPDNAAGHLRLGRALVRRRRFDEAAAEARAALDKDPGQANELLARIAFERGSPDAAAAFAPELELYPERLEARTRFGGYYLATGRTSSFVELFTDFVRRAPTAENYAIAVRALKDAGEDEQARALERRKPRGRRERRER